MVVASTDPLTSCLNRRAFTAMVDRYLDRIAAQEAGHSGALLVINIDHFKTINDRFGHVCGDEALKAIAQAIRQALREFDIFGRIGGEEFSVFLPAVSPDRAGIVADRIRMEVLATELNLGEESCRLSVSVRRRHLRPRDILQQALPPCRPTAVRSQAERPQPDRPSRLVSIPRRAGQRSLERTHCYRPAKNGQVDPGNNILVAGSD